MPSDNLDLKLARIVREAPEWVDECGRLAGAHDGGRKGFIATPRIRGSAKYLQSVGFFVRAGELAERSLRIGTCDRTIRRAIRKILSEQRWIDDCQDDFSIPTSDVFRPAVLCQILREQPDSGRRGPSHHGMSAAKPPTGLEKHRDRALETVLGELKLMFEANATTRPELDQWLLEHPDSLVKKAREQNLKEVDVVLKRVDASQNVGEAIDIVGIIENVTSHSIKTARTVVRRAREMKSKSKKRRT